MATNFWSNLGSSLGSGLGSIGALYAGQALLPGQSYDVKNVSSPQSQAALGAFMPALKRIGRAATEGKQLYQVPQAPVVDYNPQQYAPSEGWFGGLDSNIQQGLWEPYVRGSEQLLEQLGAAGVSGGASGGLSGSAASGLGKFWEQASRDVGLSGWQMMDPVRQAQARQTAAAQNAALQQWIQQIGALQAPFGPVSGIVGGAMPTPVLMPSGGK